MKPTLHLCLLFIGLAAGTVHAEDKGLGVVYEGKDGPGKGKHIVLVAGDEEYRSEEILPQLGKILGTIMASSAPSSSRSIRRTAPSIPT